MRKVLMLDLEIEVATKEKFLSLFEKHKEEVFSESSFFNLEEHLSEGEKSHIEKLRENMGTAVRVNLLAYYKEEFAGWAWGFQKDSHVFYMCNSAVLPQFRRKGIYTELMRSMLEQCQAHGFQEVYSRHQPDNSAVIIPKLKAGFVITGLNISDLWGPLVHLTYFQNKVRQKVLSYRMGTKADEEVKRVLSL